MSKHNQYEEAVQFGIQSFKHEQKAFCSQSKEYIKHITKEKCAKLHPIELQGLCETGIDLASRESTELCSKHK